MNVFIKAVDECTNFGECSATCGDGSKSCENSCQNGAFGIDSECPESDRIKTSVCKIKECHEEWTSDDDFGLVKTNADTSNVVTDPTTGDQFPFSYLFDGNQVRV